MQPPYEELYRTCNCVLDLNTRVDLDEVVSSHLIDQELSRAGISVSHALRELDCIGPNGLADLLGKMCRGCNLDNLLMTPLHGTVTLEEMNRVAYGIRQELHFDVPRALEEALDEHGAVTKGGFGLGNSTLK